MKVIESIRNNRTGEVNDVVLWEPNDTTTDPGATAILLLASSVASRNERTRRDLFKTVAIRVEFS
jgi:hypothetical protein